MSDKSKLHITFFQELQVYSWFVKSNKTFMTIRHRLCCHFKKFGAIIVCLLNFEMTIILSDLFFLKRWVPPWGVLLIRAMKLQPGSHNVRPYGAGSKGVIGGLQKMIKLNYTHRGFMQYVLMVRISCLLDYLIMPQEQKMIERMPWRIAL